MDLGKVFGIYKEDNHKVIYVLGLKIKMKKIKPMDILHCNINRNIQKNISIALQHQKTFLDYKNKHYNQEVFLIATGPTLNDFKKTKGACIYVGCNSAFLKNSELDYLFMQDYEAVRDYIEEVPNKITTACELFYGYTCEYDKNLQKVIPESYTIKHDAKRYYTDWTNIKNFVPEFVMDISSQPLGCCGSVAFPAMQFILWTNPKRIYLVGCDCSNAHYDNTPLGDNHTSLSFLIEPWKNFKNFAQRYYPETEIICVNPVGLKGIFKEVYTKSYLEKHPEIESENIEILE